MSHSEPQATRTEYAALTQTTRSGDLPHNVIQGHINEVQPGSVTQRCSAVGGDNASGFRDACFLSGQTL